MGPLVCDLRLGHTLCLVEDRQDLSWAESIRSDPRRSHLGAQLTIRIVGMGPPASSRRLALDALLQETDYIRTIVESHGGVIRFVGNGIDPSGGPETGAECMVLMCEVPWDSLLDARQNLERYVAGSPFSALWWMVAGNPDFVIAKKPSLS